MTARDCSYALQAWSASHINEVRHTMLEFQAHVKNRCKRKLSTNPHEMTRRETGYCSCGFVWCAWIALSSIIILPFISTDSLLEPSFIIIISASWRNLSVWTSRLRNAIYRERDVRERKKKGRELSTKSHETTRKRAVLFVSFSVVSWIIHSLLSPQGLYQINDMSIRAVNQSSLRRGHGNGGRSFV